MGYYSIALLGFSTMILIPQSMSQLFYIKMGEEYGRTLSKIILFPQRADLQSGFRYSLESLLLLLLWFAYVCKVLYAEL